MQKRARQLAVNSKHIDERETPKLRAGEHDAMQLAAREANLIRDLTSQVCVEYSLVFPCIVRGHPGMRAHERLHGGSGESGTSSRID